MMRNESILWPGWMSIFINKNAAWEATSAYSDSGDRHSLLDFPVDEIDRDPDHVPTRVTQIVYKAGYLDKRKRATSASQGVQPRP